MAFIKEKRKRKIIFKFKKLKIKKIFF